MLSLYTFLLHLALVFVLPYMFFRAIFRPSYRDIVPHRLGRISVPPDRDGHRLPLRLWIHCASVGEVMALGPLLKRVVERVPPEEIAISTMTRTGMDIAMKTYKGIGLFFFLPFDFPWAVGRAMHVVKPKAIVILETELWPNFLMGAKKRDIPVLLLNGRISERSFRGYKWVSGLFRKALEGVVAAAMQSEEDRKKIISLGLKPERAFVTGNLKFDSLESTGTKPSVDGSLGNRLRDVDLFIAGSTHRGEEEIILDAFVRILRSRPGVRLLLAPRHLERIDEVASLISRAGVSYVKRTQLDSPQVQSGGRPSLPEVILLDTMGELAGLYSFGRAIFVGGSLVPQGGHNVLEPVLEGKAVFFGPYMESFKEARDLLLSSGGGIVVRNSGDIQREVLRAIEDPGEYSRKGALAREAIRERRGAAQKNFSLLEPYLPPTSPGDGGRGPRLSTSGSGAPG